MNRNANILAYVIPLILLIGLLMILREEFRTPPEQSATPLTGQPIPPFQVDNLFQPTKLFTQQELQGHVALLNVWASWCPACRQEHPVLMDIKQNYHIPIYGLDYKDDPEAAKAWLQQAGNPYVTTGIDSNGAVGYSLGIYGTPETFLIDKHGIIRYSYVGVIDKSTWEQVLLPMVKKFEAE